MSELLSSRIQCPYCGEMIEILIDGSIEQQDYIEDCQVCCSPINFDVSIDQDGNPVIVATHDNE